VLVVVLAAALFAAASSLAAKDAEGDATQRLDAFPAPGWMTYTVRRSVGEGGGAYEGYGDRLEAAGRYDFTSDASTLRVVASYRWIYLGERCEDGVVDRSVVVGLSDRLYRGQTDLDDYDDHAGGPFAAWLWVPPSLGIGDHARILERDFVVVDDAPIRINGVAAPIRALRLRAEGADRREDAYGSFRTSFVDEYWFDRASGYVLRSVYRENDEGAFEGAPASFVWTEEVEVNGASYLAGTTPRTTEVLRCDDPAPLSPEAPQLGVFSAILGGGACMTFGFFVLPLLLVVAIVIFARRGVTGRVRSRGRR
jgi:hypothetical protein